MNQVSSAMGAAASALYKIDDGLWPSVPISVGNTTVVVSEHVYG
jgi:hypothetical protein